LLGVTIALALLGIWLINHRCIPQYLIPRDLKDLRRTSISHTSVRYFCPCNFSPPGRMQSFLVELPSNLLCWLKCSCLVSPFVDRNTIISTGHLMRDLYYKRNPQARSSSTTFSAKSYFEALAMNEHALTLSRGSVEVHQWIGHPTR
jgi:hypothetical protein